MLGVNALNQAQRLALGVVVLLIVDIIWVASSELTEYIFKNKKYDKPFFTTYVKTVMFSMYLIGFIIWRPWREQCCKKKDWKMVDDAWSGSPPTEPEAHLGDSIYVPVKYDIHSPSGTDSDDAGNGGSGKSVRFSNLSEVRQMSDDLAEEAIMSRLSYQAYLRAEEEKQRLNNRLSIKQVVKLAIFFCLLWFFANYTYQEALLQSEAGIVNVLSSTSGLFTLICAAIYPSAQGDKFTLSKLAAVLISLGGVVMVSMSDMKLEDSIPAGALWGLASAMLYAFYLVLVRRKVNHEDRMDIPMFFGFVGFVCAIVLWPGFFILHYSKHEPFEWPDKHQWLFIIINGLIGTVLSEILWLWACFLTSSLVATIALSLTIPLTMVADIAIRKVDYSLLFYLGSVPIFISFFIITFLTHWENWDPVMVGLKKLLHCICRRRIVQRIRELDREQTASLINSDMA
ncbi:solute carrier family 35 member F5-like [Littorina saxatilis]|uniref:Solute carrier family 35 member F5 n=1 Tax=Littorina saxatilis TaxID=31220 RepID=A0AAN9GMK6_9CAEN